MTWLKLGDEFPYDCSAVRLSADAFRLHVEGLHWVMKRETGGFLTARDIRRLADTDDPAPALAELVAVGFWSTVDGGYQIVHHMDVQPEPDEIALRRKKNAAHQRRTRRRRAGLKED